MERSWHAANHVKSHRAPEPNRGLIAADHKIELHRAETTRPRPFERMRAHGARHAFPARIRMGNVAAIGDMQAATGAIGTQVVRADNAATVLGDERLAIRSHPM